MIWPIKINPTNGNYLKTRKLSNNISFSVQKIQNHDEKPQFLVLSLLARKLQRRKTVSKKNNEIIMFAYLLFELFHWKDTNTGYSKQIDRGCAAADSCFPGYSIVIQFILLIFFIWLVSQLVRILIYI